MRNAAVVLFSMLIAAAAFGQQPKNEFSVFVTDATVLHSSDQGTQGSASFGLAFNRMLTPRVSAQFAIGYERHHTYSYIVTPTGGFQQVSALPFHTYPIDLAVRYHFLNDTRWKPYVGLGARYVRQPNVGPQFRYQNHLGSSAAPHSSSRDRSDWSSTAECISAITSNTTRTSRPRSACSGGSDQITASASSVRFAK